MVELRKRKAPAEAAAPSPPTKKSSNPVKKAVESVKQAVTGHSSSAATTNGASSNGAKIAVGHTIALEGFGGELETHTGQKVTLAQLLDQSQAGVVLFTYPKANTPGCTTQACLFRDNYPSISSEPAGLSVYGLSTDSPKSNTTFATRQSLPYPLLCDPSATLIAAIGMKKAPKSTSRGVVIIDKQGKVQVWEQAGPQKTVDAVMAYIQRGAAEESATAAEPTTATSEPAPAPASDADANADTKMTDAPLATEASTTEAAAPVETSQPEATTTAAADAVEPTSATESVDTSLATSAPEPAATLPSAAASSSSEQPTTSVPEPAKMDEVPLIKEASAEEQQAANTAAEVGETAAKIDGAEEQKKEELTV